MRCVPEYYVVQTVSQGFGEWRNLKVLEQSETVSLRRYFQTSILTDRKIKLQGGTEDKREPGLKSY